MDAKNLTFSQYKFPKPQYLGSKYVHLEWISKYIPDGVETVLDAFAGSQSVAYLFKQLGKKVLTNDFLKCNSLIGKSLVENQRQILDKEDLDILFSKNTNPAYFNLMETLFSNLFFFSEEARFLDGFRSNVRFLDNKYKEALALSVMCRSLTRKVTMGHFAHTKALAYASDCNRIKRNRSLTLPLKDIFLSILPEYNSAVFDNGKENLSYNENILELLPKLNNVDLVYFDPPYCNSHADYQSFYHLLETFVEYWKDKQFVNGTKRYEPKRYSGFDKKKEAITSLNLLFERAEHIPIWLISYNDRSYPDVETMTELILRYRNVSVEKKTYENGRGGKGSVKGSSEILFFCEK